MMVHVGLANIGSTRSSSGPRRLGLSPQMQLSVSIARTNDDSAADWTKAIEDYCISMRRAAGRTADGGGQRLLPEHARRRTVHRDSGSARLAVTALDKIDRPHPRWSRCR